jgi:hypothetical protein
MKSLSKKFWPSCVPLKISFYTSWIKWTQIQAYIILSMSSSYKQKFSW